MCGCFGTCIYCVLYCLFCVFYCSVYVYLFLFVLSVLVLGLLPPSENAIVVNSNNNNNKLFIPLLFPNSVLREFLNQSSTKYELLLRLSIHGNL